MEKLARKKALLESIVISEGVGFEYDETAISKAYKKQEENTSNIAIKILSIIGGFMGTIAFIGFLLLIGLYDSEAGLLFLGVLLVTGSLFLNKVFDKLIIDTFSISMYIIGLLLIGAGLFGYEVNENVVAIVIICIACISLCIAQNYILSFIAILAINGGFYALILMNSYYDFIHLYININVVLLAYVMLNEARLVSSHKIISKLYNPVRIGLIISLVCSYIAMSISFFSFGTFYQNIWISSVASTSIIFYVVHKVLKLNHIHTIKNKVLVYALCALILILTVLYPPIPGVLLIILLSFLVKHKTGLVIAIIALIYFVSRFYYDLTFTLLTKSIILFSSGVLFIALYVLTTKKTSTNEKI